MLAIQTIEEKDYEKHKLEISERQIRSHNVVYFDSKFCCREIYSTDKLYFDLVAQELWIYEFIIFFDYKTRYDLLENKAKLLDTLNEGEGKISK